MEENEEKSNDFTDNYGSGIKIVFKGKILFKNQKRGINYGT